jgi:hypothetical protein
MLRPAAGYLCAMDAPEELDIADGLEELDPDEVVDPFGSERTDVPVPPGELDPDDVARRSALAIALRPSVFPATTTQLVTEVAGADLDDDLLAALTTLPEMRFETLQDVWVALGGPVERRDVVADIELEAHEPVPMPEPRPAPRIREAPPARRAPSVASAFRQGLEVGRRIAAVPFGLTAASLHASGAVCERLARAVEEQAARITGP